MIIASLTDLHGDTHRIPEIAGDLGSADLVLLTGDLTHFGHREAAMNVIDAVRKYNSNILAVPGNCDYPDVEAYLTEEGINLHRRQEVINSIRFIGVGGSLPCPDTTPNEMSDSELDDCLWEAAGSLVPKLPLVVVSHQPPLRTTCDKLDNNEHVGSRLLRAFIYETKPLIVFTGHIHEGKSIDSIDNTKIVNPGPLAYGGYAMAKVTDKGVEKLELRGR